MKHLSILGSTGSIGRQTLAVVESLAGQFKIQALAAGSNLDELITQIERHRPELVSVSNAKRVDELSLLLKEKGITAPAIQHGQEGMLAVATHPHAEIVVSAAVGVVGLPATYEAIKLGRTIALSNKEVLVAAGELVRPPQKGPATLSSPSTASTTLSTNASAPVPPPLQVVPETRLVWAFRGSELQLGHKRLSGKWGFSSIAVSRRPPPHPHRFRRPFPQNSSSPASERYRRTGPRPSQLAHGQPHHH